MIANGHSWQKELLKISERIKKKKKSKKDWSGKKYTKFEKDIMLGFYIIRKLIEGKKITNKLISTNIIGKKYPNSGKQVTLLNNHRMTELYNFKEPLKQKFDLKFLINQFVHSYIFFPILALTDEGGLKFTDISEHHVTDEELQVYYEHSERELVSILFNSDDKKNDFLFEIEIEKIIKLFIDVGKCEIYSTSYSFNEKKQDYDVKLSDERNLDFDF